MSGESYDDLGLTEKSRRTWVYKKTPLCNRAPSHSYRSSCCHCRVIRTGPC